MITAYDQSKDKLKTELAYWQAQAALTDEQIIKDYCDSVRSLAATQAKSIQETLANYAAEDAYYKNGGADEG